MSINIEWVTDNNSEWVTSNDAEWYPFDEVFVGSPIKNFNTNSDKHMFITSNSEHIYDTIADNHSFISGVSNHNFETRSDKHLDITRRS